MRHPPPPLESAANRGLLAIALNISKLTMCQNNHLVVNDTRYKLLCKPIVNLAFSETISFQTQRMSSKTSLLCERKVIFDKCTFQHELVDIKLIIFE